ncbi:ribosomal-protein-alanine N-acetyltransferase [Sulfitobacter sp. THAF37]|uniref:ribosomal protein S18-alanine N-acetyltransferase n=1 Tax=Sulfitobacter sp. THAF37 TaxID=2587855 RepID=UPI0012A7E830|nr:ribosomal protein S18-alanine N-acetyltransferase [Sulfitobacter sp. THAF37]QFT59011.1 ribosomal-protein-alanine N-acetyltransferase [Sulfitobacter sp. THAF37]
MTPDTPDALARLHAAAFTTDRPWSADEMRGLLDSPHVRLHSHPQGFALTRLILDEAELLTLAVDPAHRRRGIGAYLLTGWLDSLQGRAATAFLEVAADNTAARALYERHGFAVVSMRRAYYHRAAGPDADAVIMQRRFPCGQPPVSPLPNTESG